MDRYIALTAKLVDAYQERGADVLARRNVDELRNEVRSPGGGRYQWETMHSCQIGAVERMRRERGDFPPFLTVGIPTLPSN